MFHKIILKIAVAATFILPLFAGNSCKDDKCGCSGDVQGLYANSIQLSNLYYSEDGTSCSFVVGTYTYKFCNPNKMYDTYLKLKEDNNPLVYIQGNYYWNCQYAYQSQQYQYNYYYNTPVYDLYVDIMEPILAGK